MNVELDGSSLTSRDLREIAEGRAAAVLAHDARRRMLAAREVVEEVLARGDGVYGLTTGVAERKRVLLEAGGRRAWNHLLVRSHRIAQGPAAPARTVRAAMACLVNNLARGTAGVRPELADMILSALTEGFVPKVRMLGSVGESDLGQMADLGDGLLEHTGFELAEGEGLALVNSSAFSTALSSLAMLDACRLLDSCDVAAALDLEAFGANASALHEMVGISRPYPGLAESLRRIRSSLEGSAIHDSGAARNLQDPLTFRCVPQIHGAARDALSYGSGIVAIELNASQGNPIVVLSERRLISVGNFEILPVAAAVDFARIALAPVLTSAMERSVKLLQSPLSGLPAGLAADPDTGEDALAELAIASQGIAVEARLLAQPVSYEVASSSKADGIEDRTTMAPLSARRLDEMVHLGTRVVAIEAVVAAQALDLRPPRRQGAGTAAAKALVREHAPFTARGEPPPRDLEPLVEAIRRGDLARVGAP